VITTVLFDLDGTLYDRDALVGALASEQYETFRPELAHVGRMAFVDRLIELDDHGYGSKEEAYRKIGEEWTLTDELQSRLVSHFWSAYDRHCELSPDTLHTLETLERRGMTLGVITNGASAAWQNRKIDVLGVRAFFDVVLVSETEGIRKPDPAIFLRAVERCSAKCGETVYVGDHPRVDVEGALSAGLIPVWKSVPYWQLTAPGVRKVERLSEILAFCLP
jgi:putative hydrolase of the HAD superfamily